MILPVRFAEQYLEQINILQFEKNSLFSFHFNLFSLASKNCNFYAPSNFSSTQIALNPIAIRCKLLCFHTKMKLYFNIQEVPA